MKRSELTVAIMRDRGFKPVDPNNLRLKDIVFNIQENLKYWKFLRLTRTDDIYTDTEFGMCSTYEIRMKKEYLEVSQDGKKWDKVAYRYVEVGRICLYAD